MKTEPITNMQTEIHPFIERAARLEPNQPIKVYEAETRELIGTVNNFNQAGMQLSLIKAFEINQILELVLELENKHGEPQTIKVFAELLWLKQQSSEDKQLGGFFLSGKNFKAKFRLKQLVEASK